MAAFPKIRHTKSGKEMIAESQIGGELIITRGAIGTGLLNEGESFEQFTKLKEEKMSLPIYSQKNMENGQYQIVLLVDNSQLEAGFFARELGIFAKIGSSGEEKLYSYTNAGSKADYLNDGTENNAPYQELIAIDVVVGNAQNVTVFIDETIVYVTKKELGDHEHDEAAHQELWAKLSGTPTGTIISWPGLTPPSGFLECAGQIVGQTTYPKLYEVLGTTYNTGSEGAGNFRLPDYRGEFLRGWDHGRGMDAGRALGSSQGDAIRNITGKFRLIGGGRYEGATGPFSFTAPSAGDQVHTTGAALEGPSVNFDASKVVPIASENRPRNITVMYCIKATDTFIDATQTSISQLAQELANKANKIEVQELVGNRLWASSEYTPVANATTTITHNLGIDPSKSRCEVMLVCKVAEHGYSVGDTAISWGIGMETLNTYYGTLPPIPLLKANTAQINTGSGLIGKLYALNKNSGANTVLTLANWRYVFRIWY